MIDPKQKLAQEEEDALERKPELESETLKDLTPPAGEAEGVKGGDTTWNPRFDRQCEASM